MGIKDDFLSALNVLPDGVGDKLQAGIPAAPSIGTPTTVDEAIIANGILSKYLLDLFGEFAGVTPVEILMRIGQKNIVNQGMLLAGLQYLDKGGEHEISILQPAASEIPVGEEFLIEVELFGDLSGFDSIFATLTRPDETSVSTGMDATWDWNGQTIGAANHYYTAQTLNDPGVHTLTITATVDGFEFSEGPITLTGVSA